MDMLLKAACDAGARLARPGEFSEQGFHNDKLDLAQAEAIADLIDSSSQQAARSALRSLQGDFSRRIQALLERLIELRMFVESAIDFPEEDIDFLAGSDVDEKLQQLIGDVELVRQTARQGSLLREGMHLVIAGPPNAGKSSLLNALAKREAAIVTDIPGTTRDVLREQIHIDGLPLHIIDTAGLRDSQDPVEQQGIERARQEMSRADRVLLVFDDSEYNEQQAKDFIAQLPGHGKATLIRNKIDLSGREAAFNNEALEGCSEILLSVASDRGIDLLTGHLKACAGFDACGGEGHFMARRRHLDSLQRTLSHLKEGGKQLQRAPELLAEELRQAQQTLGEVTGEFSSDDLLGEIFAGFCIGK